MCVSSDRAPLARALAALAVVTSLAAAAAPAAAQSVRLALAHPRGYFPAAGFGRLEVGVTPAHVRGLAVGGEVYAASHDDVTATTLSAYLLLRHEPFPRLPLSPFAAIGVGAHAIRNRVRVPDVGTLSATETAVKGHFWAGVRLKTPLGVHPFVETRWTVPSKYVFDYVAGGLSF